jgi:general secretion pathway protein M
MMNTDALRQLWRQRPERERRLIVLAACVLGLAGLWQWAVHPALTTWRQAAPQQAELDRQTQQMLQLQAQARQLKAPTRMARAQAVEMLETSARDMLGKDANLIAQGDQLRLSITAAPATELARWLSQAREKAQSQPLTVALQQASPAPNSAPNSSPDVLWSGQLTLRLP